jgi:hypothetical protein
MQENIVNQELGFFAATVGSQILYQSVDMFEFFVQHLSEYDYSLEFDTSWDSEILRLLKDMIERISQERIQQSKQSSQWTCLGDYTLLQWSK